MPRDGAAAAIRSSMAGESIGEPLARKLRVRCVATAFVAKARDARGEAHGPGAAQAVATSPPASSRSAEAGALRAPESCSQPRRSAAPAAASALAVSPTARSCRAGAKELSAPESCSQPGDAGGSERAWLMYTTDVLPGAPLDAAVGHGGDTFVGSEALPSGAVRLTFRRHVDWPTPRSTSAERGRGRERSASSGARGTESGSPAAEARGCADAPRGAASWFDHVLSHGAEGLPAAARLSLLRGHCRELEAQAAQARQRQAWLSAGPRTPAQPRGASKGTPRGAGGARQARDPGFG